MNPLDTETLIIRAWPGADHPNPALAAMAALIAGPTAPPLLRDRLGASFDQERRLVVLHKWQAPVPEGMQELRLEPDQMRWVRLQLWSLVQGDQVQRRAWIAGRLLTLRAVDYKGGPGLQVRHVGLPRSWTGWREQVTVAGRDVGKILALFQTVLGTLDEGQAQANSR